MRMRRPAQGAAREVVARSAAAQRKAYPACGRVGAVAAEAVIRAGDREFHVVGTVRGLVREAERVEALIAKLEPQAVALGLGPEDLQGLERLEAGASYEHDFSEADEIYAHFLGQFGEVALPPRELVAALRAARARDIPVLAVDMPEVAYVDAFTKAVTAWQLLRYNRRVRKLARSAPALEDALEFHLWWDRQICRLAGFARVERLREQHMASTLLGGSAPPGRVLVLVEAARVEGLVLAIDQFLHAGVQK